MTMEELHNTLTTYEMRIDTKEGKSTREASFKAIRKIRKKELRVEGTLEEDLNVEETDFIEKLKMGTTKHKVKLPFKCFKCGRIGHYAKRCPFKENKSFHKKNNYSKEDNKSSKKSDTKELDAR